VVGCGAGIGGAVAIRVISWGRSSARVYIGTNDCVEVAFVASAVGVRDPRTLAFRPSPGAGSSVRRGTPEFGGGGVGGQWEVAGCLVAFGAERA
jgi:Domain of unknown function (DUF397)